ncbi:hypothetical protein RCL_jg7264.t1 [Rhizophagus clarus]|uniref:Uncharacterized protein n=1 Tax=Rhizophagus clarus TaxID=94130 RepID=A0A8H3QMW8_9GLOM|nr:hypothetical protein RCL_jg7264.t1 [Rhizophagus clarus]
MKLTKFNDWFLEHLDAVFGKAVFKFLLESIGYWRFSGDYLESLDLNFNNFSTIIKLYKIGLALNYKRVSLPHGS